MEDTPFENVHNCLLDVELEHDLFDIVVDDAPVWERVRVNVHRILCEQATELRTYDTDDTSLAVRYAQDLKLFFQNLLSKNPLLADDHEYLFWGHSRRKQLDEGTWWDIYCDPLYEHSEIDFLHVESPYEYGHRTPAQTDPLRYVDMIDVTGKILRKTGLVDVTIPSETVEQIEAAEDAFESRLGVSVDLVGLVRRTLIHRKAEFRLYERLVDRVDPSLVVVVVSYGKETFLEVCQQRGIPTVELQHGVVHPYNYGYSFPGPREKTTFPDYFLTFGDYWGSNASLPIPEDRVFSVCYPFLERQSAELTDVQSTRQIVFLSQEWVGEAFSRIAVAFEEHPQADLNVVYKLHPAEYDDWRSAYPWLAESSVDIVGGEDERSLYRLFAESTHQIGVSSTAIYEGFNFELQTFLAQLPSVEKLSGLVESGHATVVDSADDLASAISSTNHAPPDPDVFFADDAVATVDETLRHLRENARRNDSGDRK